MISKKLDKRLQLGLELVCLLFLGWVIYVMWDTNPQGVAIVTGAGILAGYLLARYALKKPVVNLVSILAAFALGAYLLTPSVTEKFGDLALNWLISIPVGMYLGATVLEHRRKSSRATLGNNVSNRRP